MRGFTLVEMLFVIVIIGILMLMVFRFGGDRLQILQMQTSKETMITFREDVINNNRTASSILDQNYERVDLVFTDGLSQLQTRYYSQTGAVIHTEDSKVFPQMSWKLYTTSDVSIDQVILSYEPYTLGCQIGDDTGQIYEDILLQLVSTTHPQRYCFAIREQTCMVQEVVCVE